jgi:SAM-dependent methyltransferase
MDRDARRSAHEILSILSQSLSVKRVVDFGCGNGEWLRVWKSLGVPVVLGIDGDFVDRDRLLISPAEFIEHDLKLPLRLGQKFDLVQSLEVAEHLPDTCAESFIETLVAHGRQILFSAATPGQMGIQHINERPLEYWRKKFCQHGFFPFDWIRPKIRNQRSIAFWYRYNLLLYVHESAIGELAEEIQRTRIPDGQALKNIGPWAYRLRCGIMRWLPVAMINRITRFAHRWSSE